MKTLATITKHGETYRIRVSCGYDSGGKQIIKSTTWKPTDGMTPKQIEKELQRQAVLFEEQCRTGQFLDGNITLAEFSKRWFINYAEQQLRSRTVTRYAELMKRITPAIGHIKLCKLQPYHLIEFYSNLGENGVRLDTKYKPCDNFKQIISAAAYTQKALSEAADVSLTAIRSCIQGKNVSKETADKIKAVIKSDNLFTAAEGKTKLSDKTIAEYHRLLSSILATAVQWQVLPSNPCERVKPPRIEHKEAAALESEQVVQLIQCLDSEPLKYRTAVMLLLYTGLRRGELCGLEWDDIDLNKGIVKINKSVLYSSERGLYEDAPKTQSSNRTVAIPPDMIKLLKMYKSEQTKQRLIMGDQWQECGKVFTSENGSVINPDTLSSWFKRFVQRNNLPDIHIHSLRHPYVKLKLKNFNLFLLLPYPYKSLVFSIPPQFYYRDKPTLCR